jgi:uncharacterized phage-like protein YoqJ
MKVSGTGHRPDKLGGYSKEVQTKLVRFLTIVLTQTKVFYPIYEVNSGMALGYDQALCYACRAVGIKYNAHIPFEGFESKWTSESKREYYSLLDNANKVKVVCSAYSLSAYQKRNESLVNDGDLILALWDGSYGGTRNCIMYANKVGKKVSNLWDMYKEYTK